MFSILYIALINIYKRCVFKKKKHANIYNPAGVSSMNTHLAAALQDGGPGPPHSLSAHDVPRHVHLGVHEAPLLQRDVVVQVRLNGGALFGHDFGFDGGDLLHGHGLRERAGRKTSTRKSNKRKRNMSNAPF